MLRACKPGEKGNIQVTVWSDRGTVLKQATFRADNPIAEAAVMMLEFSEETPDAGEARIVFDIAVPQPPPAVHLTETESDLLRRGYKIQVIGAVRARVGCDLRVAKGIVDYWHEHLA